MRKKRQAYTKEFKQEAVRLVQAGDRSAIEVAASLNIDQSLLSKWVKSSELEGADAFRGHGKRTALEEEVWRLKLQNKQLTQELEFLKKVSRYFAKDPK
jgi:transposase